MSQFATAAELRDFMEITGTSGRKSGTNLGMLLTWASDTLERKTGRIITASASNTARSFTTMGRAYLAIPDLRVASTVELQGSALTADASYWLLPSRQDPAIYVGIQIRTFGGPTTQDRGWWLHNPEWFDRGLDLGRANSDGSQPNDLVITGLWGHFAVPSEWKLATVALAAYGYHHADALFAGAKATPEGNVFDLSSLPTEVRGLIEDWTIGEQAVIA